MQLIINLFGRVCICDVQTFNQEYFVLFIYFSVALQHCKMLLKGCLYAACSWNMYLSPEDLYQNSSISFLEYFTSLYPKARPRVSLFRVNEYLIQSPFQYWGSSLKFFKYKYFTLISLVLNKRPKSSASSAKHNLDSWASCYELDPLVLLAGRKGLKLLKEMNSCWPQCSIFVFLQCCHSKQAV